MIYDLIHPDLNILEMEKYRLTYAGGRDFIHRYLKRSITREDISDFELREDITYCPAFAKAGLREIINAIAARMIDVNRSGGSQSYINVVNGSNGGIDGKGNSLNSFIASQVLPELLVQGGVGIYCDRLPFESKLANENKNNYPYLYAYSRLNIRNWVEDNYGKVTNLLLQDNIFNIENGLPSKVITQYRHIYLNNDGFVTIDIYDPNANPRNLKLGEVFTDADKLQQSISTTLTQIPFVYLKLSDSLLCDVANCQIALLNIASSDLGFILKANFPFYVEEYDDKSTNGYLKGSDEEQKIRVGVTHGRRYGKGLKEPAFINPSPEPLVASMAKQTQIKEEIRLLLHLAISNLQPTRMASAESKGKDDRNLENGLSLIGTELEFGERQIATFFSEYDNSKNIDFSVHYPKNYSLKTDEDRQKEASNLVAIVPQVPSITFKREVCKAIAYILIGDKISNQKLQYIYDEIDKQQFIIDPAQMIKDLEAGLVNLETASKASGYPVGSVDSAKQDHADRLARIATSQMDANKIKDQQGDSNQTNKDQKTLSQAADTNPDSGTKQTRGNGA